MIIAAHDAEQTLAGSLLSDPEVLDDVRAVVQPADFTDHRCRLVFETVAKLRDDRKPATLEAVLIALRAQGRADDLGTNPPSYLADLWGRAPTAATAGYAAEQVRDAAMRRHSAALAVELIRDANSPTGAADELVETFTRRLSAVIDGRPSAEGPEPVRTVLRRAYDRYDANARGEGTKAITTGFPEADRVLCGGLRPQELVIVGARTGRCKSVLTRQIITSAAADGHPVLLFSLEMSNDEVVDRANADLASIPLARLRGASRMVQAETDRILTLDQTGNLGDWPIYLDQRRRLTAAQIAATTRQFVRRHGVQMIVVDYIQLVQPEDRRAARYEQVAQVTRDLKVLAAELGIVVVAAAQLSRDAANAEPELHHLRESGSLEMDADTVLLLHQPGDDDATAATKEYTLRIAKQRNGPTGVKVQLLLRQAFARLETFAPL